MQCRHYPQSHKGTVIGQHLLYLSSGRVYEFNTARKVNELLVDSLLATGGLAGDAFHDLDFDHQFIEAEKYDAEPTYKKFLGYGVGVAVIGEMIVGIETMDGNTNVHFHQQDTLRRLFERLEDKNIHIVRFMADCGSYSKEIIEVVETHCKRFYVRASRCSRSTTRCSPYADGRASKSTASASS